ncbi:hypothetical protein SLEP1_g5192 [Rubroshorea leprosula]|nr:hypothetical protein SLEP1_g5192 [Rubroshorea leprosula]
MGHMKGLTQVGHDALTSIEPKRWCKAFFMAHSRDTYMEAYKEPIYPSQGGMKIWSQVGCAPMNPPPFRKQAGIPKKKRTRHKDKPKKVSKHKTTMLRLPKKGSKCTCTICGIQGHNKPALNIEETNALGKEKGKGRTKKKEKTTTDKVGAKKNRKGKVDVGGESGYNTKEKNSHYRRKRLVGYGISTNQFKGDIILNPRTHFKILITSGSQRERRGPQQGFREIRPRSEVGESSKLVSRKERLIGNQRHRRRKEEDEDRSNGEGIGSENSRDFGPQFYGMGLEIGWESLWIGWAAIGGEADLARPVVERRTKGSCTKRGQLLGEEEEADFAQRKTSYWGKKKKQILHRERPAIGGRRRSRFCSEKGQLLGEEEEVDLAWRKAGYWAKKKKQIFHEKRPVVGQRRKRRTCTQRGRLLHGEVVGMGWAVVGWKTRHCTKKKQIENSRDFTPKSWSG